MKRILKTTEGEITIGNIMDIYDFSLSYEILELGEVLQKKIEEEKEKELRKMCRDCGYAEYENIHLKRVATWITFQMSYNGKGLEKMTLMAIFVDPLNDKYEVDPQISITFLREEFLEVTKMLIGTMFTNLFQNKL